MKRSPIYKIIDYDEDSYSKFKDIIIRKKNIEFMYRKFFKFFLKHEYIF